LPAYLSNYRSVDIGLYECAGKFGELLVHFAVPDGDVKTVGLKKRSSGRAESLMVRCMEMIGENFREKPATAP
jgi:hypothetical protein